MAKLDEARKHLIYDPEKVEDGIQMAQWEEWAGEIVHLNREDSTWVYKKLKRLWQLEEELIKIEHLFKRLEKTGGD